MAFKHFKTRLLRNSFSRWKRETRDGRKGAVDMFWKAKLEEVSSRIISDYENEIARLQQQVSLAQQQAQQMADQKTRLEADMKKAFMRGMCALNLEASTILKVDKFEDLNTQLDNLGPINDLESSLTQSLQRPPQYQQAYQNQLQPHTQPPPQPHPQSQPQSMQQYQQFSQKLQTTQQHPIAISHPPRQQTPELQTYRHSTQPNQQKPQPQVIQHAPSHPHTTDNTPQPKAFTFSNSKLLSKKPIQVSASHRSNSLSALLSSSHGSTSNLNKPPVVVTRHNVK